MAGSRKAECGRWKVGKKEDEKVGEGMNQLRISDCGLEGQKVKNS